MTAKNLYENVLIELNKENAPNIILEDFNYFVNKSINQYVNKRYNIYDISQQTTDDLRVLKATAILIPQKVENYSGLSLAGGATYYVDLPQDYLHMLNCICIYNVKKTYKCYNAGDTWRAAATRLTADAYSQVLDNYWLQPTYKRPYYYIHNVNTYPEDTVEGGIITEKKEKVLNPIYPVKSNIPKDIKFKEEYLEYLIKSDMIKSGGIFDNKHIDDITLMNCVYYNDTVDDDDNYYWVFVKDGSFEIEGDDTVYDLPNTYIPGTETHIFEESNDIDYIGESEFPRTINIAGLEVDNIERKGSYRYGNISRVRMEIRYGTDDRIFSLEHDDSVNPNGGLVYIDYLKTPQFIRLTQQLVDETEDNSQILEFPDYVCQEILNELVHIIMENISDLRIQTHPVVSLSIANPAQALAPEASGRNANQ